MLGSASVIRANSRHLPLADDSVDLVVTSPPYFALRSYQDGGEHYAGQIGDEPTPAAFVDSLLEVTRECVRVLKPFGSLWVNLGDKYGDRKSLLGLPWRYANRCTDDLGLILRAEVIWSKPNGLPESVTDRVRRSHETWFHFTRQPRYFSAVDEIREPTDPAVDRHVARYAGREYGKTNAARNDLGASNFVGNPLGKLPGSVWTVPTEPLRVPDHLGVDHFAAFPTEWPKRIIQGWSPAEVCMTCREGRRPSSASSTTGTLACACGTCKPFPNRYGGQVDCRTHGFPWGLCAVSRAKSGVVLDPFGGTGTTAMVAKALGRHGISVDMSADYCRLAEWRTNDRNQLAKVLGIEKTDAPDPDQLDLFGDSAA